jgi:hypothetical protein
MSVRQSIVRVPVTGAGTAIVDRALMAGGVTQGTNMGLAILAPATGLDAIGFLKGPHAVAADSTQTGTIWTYEEVELKDAVELEEWEYSQAAADVLAVTSTSTTTVTITSNENNADCGWMYAVSGTGAGLLAFCTAQTGGTATTKTATGWDSTTKIIKIQRFGHQTLVLNAAGTKIKTTAAVGSWTVYVWELYFQALGYPKQLLNPTKHDNLILSGARFFTRISLRKSAGRN